MFECWIPQHERFEQVRDQAIETAKRAGEICSLEWQHVNKRHVHLPKTKYGYARDLPLSAEARRIIEQL